MFVQEPGHVFLDSEGFRLEKESESIERASFLVRYGLISARHVAGIQDMQVERERLVSDVAVIMRLLVAS